MLVAGDGVGFAGTAFATVFVFSAVLACEGGTTFGAGFGAGVG